EAHALPALPATAGTEGRRALRADGPRGVSRLARHSGEVAQRHEAGQEEVRASLDRDEARHVRHALADAVGRDRERAAERRRRCGHWIRVVVEPVELRVVQPGVTDELELALDV